MTTIYKYRLRCNTEGTNKTVWSETTPTVCPTGGDSHSIDTTSIVILEENKQDVVILKEELIPTGGNFQCTTLQVVANAGTTVYGNISWPFNITALGVNFVTEVEHMGDEIEMTVGKDTIIGVTTAITNNVVTEWISQDYLIGNVVTWTHPVIGTQVYTCIQNTIGNASPTSSIYWQHGFEINVSSTVISYTMKGYYIKLGTEDLGRVLFVNTSNNKIYMERAPTIIYPATSYVKQTVYVIKDYHIGHPWNRTVGDMKLGGSAIPKNTLVEVKYVNNSLDTTKELIGHTEFLY